MCHNSIERSLLLDELDLGIATDADTDAVKKSVIDYLEDTFCTDRYVPVYLDLYAISVERLDVSEVYTHRNTMLWIEEGEGFQQMMSRFVSSSGIPEECAEYIVRTGDHNPALNQLTTQLHEALSQKEYGQVRQLADWLAGCQHSGLPRVKRQTSFDCCYWLDICDFRKADYGPRTRLLVEFELS